ncbi:MAG: hypothetical protein K6T81_18740 [Alicyclobacillus macrosporangiidus]|uniref:RHS repeat-associated core domain-containing protein n=1 Tax=Alicyclobacillus macrosporangiidus TaxID=392015 RepID=UPI0026E931FA|nr:RHS repeat-associated core domain-containing protein [Alicyclobacillus macrosporangiidus]MCL6600748.1 hypothetical protein [Alicyclobacillus macrosporangiidus]
MFKSVCHPNGSSSSLTYDAANRLTGVTDTLGSTTDTFGFAYYNDGTVKSVSQGSSQVYSYTYDKLGQLQTVTQPYSGTVNNTETFTPDPDGNLKTIAYAVGSTTWNVNNTYNDGNQLMSATDGTGTVNFAYAPTGFAENISDASGVTTYYTYYPNLQVSEVRAVDKKGNVLEDYTYTYDANGNLKQITDTTSNTSLSFTYDSLNQLTQETTWTGDTISYTYDKLGNRTSVTDAKAGTTTNYGYTAEDNRLTSVGLSGFTYDADGQLTNYGSTTYTWNAENRLSKITNGSQVDTYTYDPFGRRITINGNHIAYIGGSNLVAYETNSSNRVISRFVYNSAGLPVLWNYNGKEYGYVYDGLGNIIGLVDETSSDSTYGTEVVKYTYDAWGNVLAHTDSTNTGLDTANPFIYRGYWYDWDTGLYYLNARYYNPMIGRFLSEDPVGPNVGDALSYNQYAYARNNPQSFVDANGDWSRKDTVMVAAGVVAIAATGGVALTVIELVELAGLESAMAGEIAQLDIFGVDQSETLTASKPRQFAQRQGWKSTKTSTGPEKWFDQSGSKRPRLIIKQGSSRTPGSEGPHVEIFDETGQRIDRYGNPVSKRSPENHTPIIYDEPYVENPHSNHPI